MHGGRSPAKLPEQTKDGHFSVGCRSEKCGGEWQYGHFREGIEKVCRRNVNKGGRKKEKGVKTRREWGQGQESA
jgi:hypothetical protein